MYLDAVPLLTAETQGPVQRPDEAVDGFFFVVGLWVTGNSHYAQIRFQGADAGLGVSLQLDEQLALGRPGDDLDGRVWSHLIQDRSQRLIQGRHRQDLERPLLTNQLQSAENGLDRP